ncbi:MAG TPA: recombination mediator RecR [Bacteroidia bacterium]|nr:recombination mediator RecR [Bacteroidia bacterium]
MDQRQYPSLLLEKAVQELSKLPGIGQKTAFRLLMHMLRSNKESMILLADSLNDLAHNVQYCERCFSISDGNLCEICSNHHRDQTTICIVEDVNDLMAIEKTHQYNGLYHVLGGLISPLDGISPAQLTIDSLEKRLENESISELIFAFSATVEGDTTAYYLFKKFSKWPIQITTIAKGVAVGNELEYTDEITLARSIKHRLAFDGITK